MTVCAPVSAQGGARFDRRAHQNLKVTPQRSSLFTFMAFMTPCRAGTLQCTTWIAAGLCTACPQRGSTSHDTSVHCSYDQPYTHPLLLGASNSGGGCLPRRSARLGNVHPPRRLEAVVGHDAGLARGEQAPQLRLLDALLREAEAGRHLLIRGRPARSAGTVRRGRSCQHLCAQASYRALCNKSGCT